MPVSPEQREWYLREFEARMLSAIVANDQAAEGAAAVVRDAMLAAFDRLRRLTTQQWSIERVKDILRELDEVWVEMGGELQQLMRRALTGSVQAGSDALLFPLGQSGIISADVLAGFPVISPQLINMGIDFTGGLIVDVTDEVRRGVGRLTTSGLLSGHTPFETIETVQAFLFSQGVDSSTFPTLALRAEAQVRTEGNRWLSAAQRVRGAEIHSMVGLLIREWMAHVSDGRTRSEHLAAHKQRRPFDQQFDVGGEKLWFPRDPAGSGWNTIQCRCWELYDIPRDVSPNLALPSPNVAEVEISRFRLELDRLMAA